MARIHFDRRPAPAEPTRRSPGRAERAAPAAAAVVQRVSVLDAEAAVTLAAGHRQHLLPPAAASGAPVPKHLKKHRPLSVPTASVGGHRASPREPRDTEARNSSHPAARRQPGPRDIHQVTRDKLPREQRRPTRGQRGGSIWGGTHGGRPQVPSGQGARPGEGRRGPGGEGRRPSRGHPAWPEGAGNRALGTVGAGRGSSRGLRGRRRGERATQPRPFPPPAPEEPGRAGLCQELPEGSGPSKRSSRTVVGGTGRKGPACEERPATRAEAQPPPLQPEATRSKCISFFFSISLGRFCGTWRFPG